ncbi:MAG: hypothetical protein ABIT36_10740 [Steroidobacteraceae bacterium]
MSEDPGINTTITAMPPLVPAEEELVQYTQWIYALHALSVIVGLVSSAFIITAFVFGLPSIIAVIMNYVRRSRVRGTWLESHFRWQIRTFWTTAIAAIVIAIVCAPFMLLLGLGLLMAWIGFAILGLWVAYRVVRGWLALRDRRPMYT